MDLRRLRYFVAVAEERHITRAAARLGMAQPPLSQQILALEAELGVALFHRLPSGVQPTAAGIALLEDARALLDGADRAAHRAQLVAQGQSGELAVGMTTSAALHDAVPELLRRYRTAHAGVALDLREGNAADMTEGLLAGTLDAALLRAPVARPAGLDFHELDRERVLAALPPGTALPSAPDGLPRVRLGALREENFILVRRRAAPGLYANVVEACRATGFEPRIANEVGRMLTALNLVAAGAGISFVPACMHRISHGGVVFAAVSAPAPIARLLSAPLTLALRTDEARPAVRGFLAAALRRAARN